MADDTNFNRIMAGLGEVADIVEGRAAPARVYAPEDVDVRSIRQRLQMSQSDFAARYGFGVAAVRDWEQKRRRPEAAARVLLTVIDKAPDVVSEALRLAALDNGAIAAGEPCPNEAKGAHLTMSSPTAPVSGKKWPKAKAKAKAADDDGRKPRAYDLSGEPIY